ncbi:MAG: hypothetical protein U1A78_27480 [Polyangia bacterium]
MRHRRPFRFLPASLLAAFLLAASLLGGAPAAAVTPSSAEKACGSLKGAPAADCFSAVATSYIDRVAIGACERLGGPALLLSCVRAIVNKRYTPEEVADCAGLLSPWEVIQCLATNGRSGAAGGCNSYGCWTSGGGCSSYGCWTSGGGCNTYGCWYGSGGGCNNYGCWHSATAGCNNYGCWRNGGGCNNYGCWHSAAGKCNSYGCSDFGECVAAGCPK